MKKRTRSMRRYAATVDKETAPCGAVSIDALPGTQERPKVSLALLMFLGGSFMKAAIALSLLKQ